MIERVDASAAEALAKLHGQGFEAAWSAADIAAMFNNPSTFALAARDGEMRGFVMAWVVAGEAELLTLAVAPEARRRGVGAELVAAACAAAAARGAGRLHLEVAADNEAARALYAKLGFAEAGRRAGYYKRKAGLTDAILMQITLSASAP